MRFSTLFSHSWTSAGSDCRNSCGSENAGGSSDGIGAKLPEFSGLVLQVPNLTLASVPTLKGPLGPVIKGVMTGNRPIAISLKKDGLVRDLIEKI
jgi:hypothetical protein